MNFGHIQLRDYPGANNGSKGGLHSWQLHNQIMVKSASEAYLWSTNISMSEPVHIRVL